ncbi:hypothetical protein [Streptomyces sp. NPDC021622]|uniref:hypothetical protein n=1 Tax=Streptomyces sp. NPDC021622 TaxID=3155013 RepID=UPI0034036AC3
MDWRTARRRGQRLQAAVLYHFSSKGNLTRAALEHVLAEFTAYVDERVAAEPDPRAAVVARVRAMIGYQQANRRHVRVITQMLLDDEGGTRLKTPGGHDTGGAPRRGAGLRHVRLRRVGAASPDTAADERRHPRGTSRGALGGGRTPARARDVRPHRPDIPSRCAAREPSAASAAAPEDGHPGACRPGRA